MMLMTPSMGFFCVAPSSDKDGSWLGIRGSQQIDYRHPAILRAATGAFLKCGRWHMELERAGSATNLMVAIKVESLTK